MLSSAGAAHVVVGQLAATHRITRVVDPVPSRRAEVDTVASSAPPYVIPTFTPRFEASPRRHPVATGRVAQAGPRRRRHGLLVVGLGIGPVVLAAGAAVARGRGDDAARLSERSAPQGAGVLASIILVATGLVILAAVVLSLLDMESDA
jgi:hypothetical protein